jgi:hypothetical protein
MENDMTLPQSLPGAQEKTKSRPVILPVFAVNSFGYAAAAPVSLALRLLSKSALIFFIVGSSNR